MARRIADPRKKRKTEKPDDGVLPAGLWGAQIASFIGERECRITITPSDTVWPVFEAYDIGAKEVERISQILIDEGVPLRRRFIVRKPK